ncbi:hypothetical protein Psfp_01215 [Pelotomaculum sp. FP]|nr:hypothetical protein Psfp_01215 [Pelotomaculum sp. FP]
MIGAAILIGKEKFRNNLETDKILPEGNEWQNRPLEAIYPIIYFDGIVFKSRKDSRLSTSVFTRF